MADGFDGEIRLGVKLTPTDVKKTASQLQQEIEKIFNTSAGQKTSKQFQQMEIRLDGLYNKSQKLQESLKAMENTKIPTQAYKDADKAFDNAAKKAEVVGKRMEQLQLKLDASTTSRRRKSAIQAQMEQEEKTLEHLFEQMAQWEYRKEALVKSGEAFTLGSDTQEYKNTANQLNGVNNEIVKTISATEALQQQEEELPEPVQRTSQAAEHLKSAMSKVGNLISKVLHGLGNMAKALGGKIVSATKKLVSQFSKLGHHSDKHQLSLKKMARMMLKYGLGIRSVFLLWRKLRSYATEAIKTMARNFEEVDADVSMLMNSFNQMKNSMGTMVQPLLHALAPALNYIIGLITSAMNALANFFAILTGQKYIYKATKQNKSYADSLGGVGGAAKDANKELAEYDNLLVIKSQEEGSGGGGGGGADTGAGLFEKVEAESDFAKQLKDTINKGDWEGVGGLFANKLNIITRTFDDWINTKFRPTAVTWSSRIARILNGLTEGWDSNLTGKTIADGFNAILDTANTFFTTYKFKRLGERVGGLIKGFFDNMDPVLLGKTFANKINAAIDFATGLVNTTPWAEIGDKLGTALKTWFETVKWEDLGADLQKLASGILTSLAHFVQTSKLGTTVGTAINEFLNGIDFGQLAEDLSTCAKSIIGAIADLIKTIDWYEVGKAIADLLTNIDWIGLAVELGKVALALIKGLAQALLGLASNPEALADIATALLAIFGAKWVWGKVKSVFSEGLGTALSGAVGDNGLWGKIKGLFKKNTTTAVTEGVSEAASDSGAVAQASGACNSFLTKAVAYIAAYEIGGKIGSDLVSGIFGALGASDEYLEEVKKYGEAPITYTANAIKETIVYAFEDSTKGIPDAIEMLAKEINQAMLQGTIDYQGVMDKIQEVPEKYRDTLIQVADETQATLDKIHENQQKFGSDTVETTEKMNASWSDYADNYSKTTKEVESDNKDIEKSFYQMSSYIPPTVKDAMEQTADNIEDALEPVPGTVANIGTGAYMSLTAPFDLTGDLFEQKVADINSAFAPLPNDLGATSASALQSVQTNFATDALTGHFTTVRDNIEAPFSSLPSFFSDTFKQSWNEAESAFSSGQTTFNSFNTQISQAMTSTINGLIDGLNNAVGTPFRKIQEIINRYKNVKFGVTSPFSSLPSFSGIPSIPHLAQGAVIPPNREFMAMLGDQTNGTNIETPLATMVQAFKTALSEMGGNTNQSIVLQLDSRTVAQCVWDEEDKRYKQTGRR